MTPGLDWRASYADWPEALAKLEYCDRLMRQLRDQEPAVTAIDLDWDVGNLDLLGGRALRRAGPSPTATCSLPGLDGALQAIFEDLGEPEDPTHDAPRLPAADLIRKWERDAAWPTSSAGPATSPSAPGSCCGIWPTARPPWGSHHLEAECIVELRLDRALEVGGSTAGLEEDVAARDVGRDVLEVELLEEGA